MPDIELHPAVIRLSGGENGLSLPEGWKIPSVAGEAADTVPFCPATTSARQPLCHRRKVF